MVGQEKQLVEKSVKIRKKARIDARICAACGCCEKECPMSAAYIYHGVAAMIDESRCVGCGRCAAQCPADAIEIYEVL